MSNRDTAAAVSHGVEALIERFGADGPAQFQRMAVEAMERLNAHSRVLFRNWLVRARDATD